LFLVVPLSITIKDVAEYAGVSVATVSRVLNQDHNVSDELRAKVLDAVEALDYQRNRVARSLRVKTSQIFGLVISDIRNPFFTSVVRGVEDVAYSNGYTLILCNSDEDPSKERMYIDIVLAERVAGVIISPVSERDNYSKVLVKAGVPVVAVDRTMLDLDIDAVVVDNVGGAYHAVRHAIGRGHRRIGFIGGPTRATTGRERLAGYTRALTEHGITVDQELIRIGDFKQQSGFEMALLLLGLGNPPTAIFAANNLMTLGALDAIHARGFRIPDDLCVVGFDDPPWTPLLSPSLTAVSQPTYQLGETAAKLLLKRIGNPQKPTEKICLKADLIIRESC
jgi:LacI family transcriptional regulator